MKREKLLHHIISEYNNFSKNQTVSTNSALHMLTYEVYHLVSIYSNKREVSTTETSTTKVTDYLSKTSRFITKEDPQSIIVENLTRKLKQGI